jgi:DNA-binding Lrp family transcriptional regulator
MPLPSLDVHDVAVVRALQDNARLTVAQLAEMIHLSTSPTWRRVKRLEADGVVTGYRAPGGPARGAPAARSAGESWRSCRSRSRTTPTRRRVSSRPR